MRKPVAIVNAKIVLSAGKAPIRKGAVVIEGKRIVDVGTEGSVEVPSDAKVADVELKTMDWPSFAAALVKPEEKEYEAVFVGWGPGVPDAHFTLYGQFHSSRIPPGGLALAFYNNSEVDEAAREEL